MVGTVGYSSVLGQILCLLYVIYVPGRAHAHAQRLFGSCVWIVRGGDVWERDSQDFLDLKAWSRLTAVLVLVQNICMWVGVIRRATCAYKLKLPSTTPTVTDMTRHSS